MSSISQDRSVLSPLTGHLAWLDWLRFGAAFAVLLCHARGGHWMDWGSLEASSKTGMVAAFFAMTRPNQEPVVVFFVLSGFLVGGRLIEKLINGSFCAAEYTLDRFSRIYIPLVPALALSAIAASVLGNQVKVAELAGNLLSLQGIACKSFAGNEPLWSLAYEVWFYVLAGSFVAVASVRVSRRVLALFLFAGGILVYAQLSAVLLYCWLLGAAAYPLHKLVLPKITIGLGLLLTLAGAAASQLSMQSRSLAISVSWLPSRDIAILIMSAGFALSVAWLARRPVETLLAARFQSAGTTLAAFSYTLYLTHYPVLLIMGWFNPGRHADVTMANAAFLLGKLGVCLFVAWLLYLPFERRTGQFRSWFRARYM
jgi:peptidoglycan/LPS O-acetylase OafA/YrhL